MHIERVCLASVGSIEERARDARYSVFERLMGRDDCLLLAHHRDDQLETLLFRVLRGTGLRGLAGMPRSRALGAAIAVLGALGVARLGLRAAAELD